LLTIVQNWRDQERARSGNGNGLTEPQLLVLRSMIASLQSGARDGWLNDPFGAGAVEGEQPGDPFAYSDLRGDQELVVPISKYPDGSPSWEDTVANMLRDHRPVRSQ
jgi:hypothetical protein